MQIFSCPACEARLYFDSLACLACGQVVALDPFAARMVPGGGGAGAGACDQRGVIGCNWTSASGNRDAGARCLSCATTRTIPDPGVARNAHDWQQAEAAKRWVLWGLMRLGWFGPTDRGPLPVFDMVAEQTAGGAVQVTIRHADGVITLNVSEADPARVALRQAELGELYRTMMGHLRHEIAHFLFWRLGVDGGFLNEFRARFGDERTDYGKALEAHYANPRPPGETHISGYATAHPHEDWAETAAHALHLFDIAHSFDAAGLRLGDRGGRLRDADGASDPLALIEHAAEIGLALNHVNRAMGLADLYPFVLPPAVRGKLAFALAALRRGGDR
ncbi:MAG: putative zinc-binding metallopeptidase [Rubellimicrobium sp.]|nr:putative zinc-binding metallopeptidase [Rubellimicrobium sp.]